MSEFRYPLFNGGCIEIWSDDDGVAIYGTPEGIIKPRELCDEILQLSERGKTEHIHLEDRNILTSDSLSATLAVFLREDEPRR